MSHVTDHRETLLPGHKDLEASGSKTPRPHAKPPEARVMIVSWWTHSAWGRTRTACRSHLAQGPHPPSRPRLMAGPQIERRVLVPSRLPGRKRKPPWCGSTEDVMGLLRQRYGLKRALNPRPQWWLNRSMKLGFGGHVEMASKQGAVLVSIMVAALPRESMLLVGLIAVSHLVLAIMACKGNIRKRFLAMFPTIFGIQHV